MKKVLTKKEKRNSGNYYTPESIARYTYKKTQELYPDFNKNMVVWDCACGDGGLTKYWDFDHLYSSTIFDHEIEEAKNNGLKNVFNFDFLNDDLSKAPQALADHIKAGKDIMFYINPPYAGVGNLNFQTEENTKIGNSFTNIKTKMQQEKYGMSANQLYLQFLYRIDEFRRMYGCRTIIVFMTAALYMTSVSSAPIRKKILNNYEYKHGFAFQGSEFQDVSKAMMITTMIFDSINKSNQTNNYKSDLVRTNKTTKEVEVFGHKYFTNLDATNYETSLLNWVRRDIKELVKKEKLTYEKYPQACSGLNMKDDPIKGRGRMIKENNIAVFKTSEYIKDREAKGNPIIGDVRVHMTGGNSILTMASSCLGGPAFQIIGDVNLSNKLNMESPSHIESSALSNGHNYSIIGEVIMVSSFTDPWNINTTAPNYGTNNYPVIGDAQFSNKINFQLESTSIRDCHPTSTIIGDANLSNKLNIERTLHIESSSIHDAHNYSIIGDVVISNKIGLQTPYNINTTAPNYSAHHNSIIGDVIVDNQPSSANNFLNFSNSNIDSNSTYNIIGSYDQTPSIFDKTMITFASRISVPMNWMNDKSEYSQPDLSLLSQEEYEDYAINCLIYNMFHSRNNCSSMRDVPYDKELYTIRNQFFWGSRKRILDLCVKHKNEDILKDLIVFGDDETYIFKHLLSHPIRNTHAIEIIIKAQELIDMTFPYREELHKQYPELHLNTWDAGIYQIKKLQEKIKDETIKEHMKDLYYHHKELEKEICEKVYQLGMLSKDVIY